MKSLSEIIRFALILILFALSHGSPFHFLVVTSQFPNTITYDEAATIPLCFHTAALGFYGTYDVAVNTFQFRGLGLDIPVGQGASKYKDEPILIPGGASSVGQFGT